MRVPALALAFPALAFLPSASSAEVDIRVATDGRVSVRADAPASEVLDRLASRTGMKVVYEGPAPRGRVMVSFEGRTSAEAVLMVLEGLGVDHLMRLDATGTRPEMLMLSASSSSSSSASRPLPAAGHASPAIRPAAPDEPVEEEEEPPPDEQPLDETEPAAARRPPVPGQPPVNAVPGQQAAPQVPGNRPSFQPSNYPVSPFAPAAPAPPTIVAPPTPTPAPESSEPDQ